MPATTLISSLSTETMMSGPSDTKTDHAEAFYDNSMVIWYHDENLSIDKQRLIQHKLNSIFKCVRTFTDKEKFIAYLNHEFIVETLKFIVCSKQVDELCSLTKIKSKDCCIYELDVSLTQSIRKSSNAWVTYSNIKELFEAISRDIRKSCVDVDENNETTDNNEYIYKTCLPPLGIFNSLSIPRSFHFLNKESSTFVLFQLLNKIIIDMKHTPEDLDDMWCFCRKKYQINDIQMKNIKIFKDKYRSNEAIKYYTASSFLFRSLDDVLRHEIIDDIYQFRHYIADLHKQLKQISMSSDETIMLYRGKKVSLIVLQQLTELYDSKDVKDKLISTNGFLSTTLHDKIAETFAGIEQKRDGYESVIFQMCINKEIATKVPYANISHISKFTEEDEFLFSMGSVWQLTYMERSSDDVWTIKLTLSNTFDDQLDELDKQLCMDHSSNDYYLFLLARISYELGNYSTAVEYLHRLLENELSDEFKNLIRFHLATMLSEQGQYTDAQKHLEEIVKSNKSETIATDEMNSHSLREIYATKTMLSQLTILNNLGVLHQKKCDRSKARNYFTKALEEYGSPLEKAMVHNNLGNLENFSGNISEAHKHLKKAVGLVGNCTLLKQFKKDLENVEKQQNNNA